MIANLGCEKNEKKKPSNFSFFFSTEKTLADGDFFLSVSYGGKDLYENQWKFCEMEEEEEEDRWIFCPYKPGSYSWVIDRKIPNFLPKVCLFTSSYSPIAM